MLQTRAVTQAITEKDFEKAMSLRDPEFRESLEGFHTTSVLDTNQLPAEQVRLCSHWKPRAQFFGMRLERTLDTFYSYWTRTSANLVY